MSPAEPARNTFWLDPDDALEYGQALSVAGGLGDDVLIEVVGPPCGPCRWTIHAVRPAHDTGHRPSAIGLLST